jgi:hypothetical protein
MAAIAAKKETAKVQVTPPARPAPQATVKIGAAAPAATPAPAMKREAVAAPEAAGGEPDPLIGTLAIAAAVVALASLGMQLWMFL